jgi:hypothetical protein
MNLLTPVINRVVGCVPTGLRFGLPQLFERGVSGSTSFGSVPASATTRPPEWSTCAARDETREPGHGVRNRKWSRWLRIRPAPGPSALTRLLKLMLGPRVRVGAGTARTSTRGLAK